MQTASQKAGKLSPETSAQGYHCNCGQTAFVLLLSVSSATVNTFRCFLATSVPLPSKSLSPAISLTHTQHFLPLLLHTGSFSCYIFLCLIHYFACPFLSTSFCPPFVSLSLHYLSHSPSPWLSHLPFSVELYSRPTACRDCLFLLSSSFPYLAFVFLHSASHSPPTLSPSLFLSLSKPSLISLHSLSEGHMYFHRWSAIVCLLHLFMKILNSWRQQVLMKL